MTAILHPAFMQESVHFPTADEKEEAKIWVEAHLCKVWRNGWCLIDGTLVPLFTCPYWFGESYFDRKCNYSLNIQVSLISTCGLDDANIGCNRLYHYPTYTSLTSVMAIWAALTMQLLGKRCTWHNSTMYCLRIKSGFGLMPKYCTCGPWQQHL